MQQPRLIFNRVASGPSNYIVIDLESLFGSSAQICLSQRKTRQVSTPSTPMIKKSSAAPLPLPTPNRRVSMLPAGNVIMNGSSTRSTKRPPSRYPTGIVKNCSVFRAEYTRPCISIGMYERNSTFMLALITGMKIHPSTAARHHTGVERPKASKKFSVPMEKSSELQITRTRLLGAARSDTRILPASVASPINVFTNPTAVSPPSAEKAAWLAAQH